ncbi:MAG TPA: hypothetical protein VHG91_12425 [Longimicrobium sp.]|nr:hypothetical protein [Longimicrobium sp.]
MTLLVSIFLLAGSVGAIPDAQTACPAATAETTQIATRLASAPDYADTRQKYGLPTSTVMRILNDSADAATCGRITAFVDTMTPNADWRTRWSPAYYRVGALYYVVLTPKPISTAPPPPGKVDIDLSWSGLYVLDSSFNLVAGLAM